MVRRTRILLNDAGSCHLNAGAPILSDSEAVLDIDQEELLLLDSKGWFMKYIILVEAAIRKCSGLDAKQKLWRQLIMVSIGFATRSIEQKRWAKAMGELNQS